MDWYAGIRRFMVLVTYSTLFSHRTLLPLQYPPHIIALGGLYVACLLTSFEQPLSDNPERIAAEEIAQKLKKKGDWERKFQSQVEDLEGKQKSRIAI